MKIKNKGLWIALFTIPCMLLFALVYAAPIVTVVYTSLCNYTTFSSPEFAGVKNFVTIFGDKDFLVSIKNTLLWVLLQAGFHVTLGLIMALVLRRKPKGWQVVRTAYMIPNIIPTAATGVMFTLLLNPSFGVVKPLWEKLGVNTSQVPNLFGNSRYAFWTVTFTWILYSGFNTIIFLAEMGAIDKEIYEAARVDGAKPWQLDRYITLPLMKSAIASVLMLGFIYTFKAFDLQFVMTSGGPLNATDVLGTYSYMLSFTQYEFSLGSATAMVLFCCLFVIGLFYLRMISKEDD